MISKIIDSKNVVTNNVSNYLEQNIKRTTEPIPISQNEFHRRHYSNFNCFLDTTSERTLNFAKINNRNNSKYFID